MNKLFYFFFIVIFGNKFLFAITSDEYINNTNCDQIIDKNFLKICYNYNLKVAKAVSYTLDGDLVNELNIKKRPSFKRELALDIEYRAYSSDYTRSGYTRGHLAPDAAFDWSQESLNATYTLANIVPQAEKVNKYTWTKAERYARFVAVQRGSVNVLNLVMYSDNPQRIGKHGIAVPKGYYKILYSNDQSYTRCLYYKNDVNLDTKSDKLREHDIDCSEVPGQIKKIDYSFLIPILMINQ